jgi:hypothetical protein
MAPGLGIAQHPNPSLVPMPVPLPLLLPTCRIEGATLPFALPEQVEVVERKD